MIRNVNYGAVLSLNESVKVMDIVEEKKNDPHKIYDIDIFRKEKQIVVDIKEVKEWKCQN